MPEPTEVFSIEIDPQSQPVGSSGLLDRKASVAIILLAAGKASRMGKGGAHKLLAEFDGVPLVRRAALAALGADAATVAVVTGHRRNEIETALYGLDMQVVENPDYTTGIASSLVAGFAAPGVRKAEGVLVMLADMPGVTSVDLDALIAAFRMSSGQVIVRAVSNGKRGNPVILPRTLARAVTGLVGDIGARQLIEASGLPVIDVDIGDAAHLDVDTPQEVVAAGGVLRG
ncbi:nucleotidyltransferase family protein [Rhizobium leguminosarum]|uniref:nucleotidyltransferase family protein n=1 Tax=Rhizobium leguminosarum TaxID=384 RepID=UPI003F945AA8